MAVFQPCPLCGDARYRKLKRFPDGVVVGECIGCGLLYTPLRHPEPDTVHGEIPIAELRERYGPILRGERRHYRTKVYHDYLRHIARHVPRGRLLDVGCAHGFFLVEARARGYEVAGVEAHPHMAEFARSALGLQVADGRWAESTPPTGPFDVITFNDCLEYMPDPVGALGRAFGLLTREGVVFVKTPNADYFRLRQSFARILGRDLGTGEAFGPSTRVVHFTSETLRRTARAARLWPVEAGSPRPVPSPRWHRSTGVWLEWEAPPFHGMLERVLRQLLQQLGRLEMLITGKANHLSPSLFLIARAATETSASRP